MFVLQWLCCQSNKWFAIKICILCSLVINKLILVWIAFAYRLIRALSLVRVLNKRWIVSLVDQVISLFLKIDFHSYFGWLDFNIFEVTLKILNLATSFLKILYFSGQKVFVCWNVLIWALTKNPCKLAYACLVC